jgi:type VI protein secretion system component VasF
MNDTLARQIHQVLGAGLELKEKLERGESPTFDIEHARLKGLLLGDSELRYLPDYTGDGAGGSAASSFRQTQAGMRGGEAFLGARYALACWLDEIFIADSPWSSPWTEQTLEVALYGGSSQRAWRFWEQAKKSEARSGGDALEAYLWCVMLGFRGEPPPDLHPAQWVEGVRKRLVTARSQDFAQPAERELPTFVPVLRGRDRFGTMLRVGAGVVALIAFAAGVLLLKP